MKSRTLCNMKSSHNLMESYLRFCVRLFTVKLAFMINSQYEFILFINIDVPAKGHNDRCYESLRYFSVSLLRKSYEP